MNLKDFDYYLPPELIAKYPAVPRHSARLMVLNRKDKSIKHDIFWNLPQYLEEETFWSLTTQRFCPQDFTAENLPVAR